MWLFASGTARHEKFPKKMTFSFHANWKNPSNKNSAQIENVATKTQNGGAAATMRNFCCNKSKFV